MIGVPALLLYGFLTGLLVGLLSPVYGWYVTSRPSSPHEIETMRITNQALRGLHQTIEDSIGKV